ncbi:MAG: TerB family tellurite resistance protein [Lentisphaeraceae bacterium]|nr:TerB family tellurite resistance protein [Lentisphaeraceae bacterium]
MLQSLISLFTDTKNDKTKEERQASVALVILIMYIDNHLAESEAKVLRREVGKFSWTGIENEEYFVNTHIAKVRDIREIPVEINKYITLYTAKLKSPKAAGKLIRSCQDMVNADGKKHPKECEILTKIREQLSR